MRTHTHAHSRARPPTAHFPAGPVATAPVRTPAAVRQILGHTQIQPKLQVGPVDDRFEREADRMADEVMRAREPNATLDATNVPVATSATQSRHGQMSLLQRKCACGAGASGLSGECKECSKKKLGLQKKPRISEPDDVYEEEADRVADHVMGMAEPQLQRSCACGGKCPECWAEQSGQEHERLQTSDAGPIAAPLIVNGVLAAPGQPLDPATRGFMEPRFGHDFSQVRVHTDARAAGSATALRARAYTVGRDIVFAAGQYTTGSEIGRRLLAHELVHTMQQNSGAVRVQRAAWPTAGGCAAEGETVEEQRDEASWAGYLAHLQIQKFFFPTLDLEASMPRATKDDRGPSCPPSGTPKGHVDLWHYDGAGHAQIGEIKSIKGEGYAAPEVIHYIIRFSELVSRMTGGSLCRDKGDQEDAKFDQGWLNGDLVNDRRVPWAGPLDGIVPAVPTVIGGFWGDPANKELRCELRAGGAVIYWCNEVKERDEEAAEKAWQAVMIGQQLFGLRSSTKTQKEHQKQEEQNKQKERKKHRQAVSSAPGGAAATGSRIAKLARFAARASLLFRIAEATVNVYAAFAEWSYTGMYWGTRGYNLNQMFKRLAVAVESLANAAGYAVELQEDLATASLYDPSGEQAMRAELFSSLKLVRKMLQDGAAELNEAMQYSAIENRVNLNELNNIQLVLANADAIIQQDDDSEASLSLVTHWEEEAAIWLLENIEHLFDRYEAIVKDDQKAWLDIRR